MTVITRNERDYLVKQGFKMSVDIFKSHSKHPKYYLVSSPRVLDVLNQYRKNVVTKTVQWVQTKHSLTA